MNRFVSEVFDSLLDFIFGVGEVCFFLWNSIAATVTPPYDYGLLTIQI